MIQERMYDLAFDFDASGMVRLEQDAGAGETTRIDLHPCQLRLLCERAGILHAPDPGLVDKLGALHARRLRALRDEIGDLRDLYTDTILDRCGEGVEIFLYFRMIEGMACELVEDLGTAEHGRNQEPTAQRNEKSPDISVTPEHPKRGRPTTGEALSNAERQARHREKQTDAPVQNALALTGDGEKLAAGMRTMPEPKHQGEIGKAH